MDTLNILNIEEVIFNLASIVNYYQLTHLSSINKTYYSVIQNIIKEYSYTNIVKDLNIKVIMSHYKAPLSEPIDLDKFTYGKSTILIYPNNIIIICNKDNNIDDIMNEFNKQLIRKITECRLLISTIMFKIIVTDDQYNKLVNIAKKTFCNCKTIIINQSKFKIFKNGKVQTSVKERHQFLENYKSLIMLIRNI